MKIEDLILTKNGCYKAGRTIKPKGIMVHSLGVAQPNIDVFLRTLDTPSATVCVHALVGKDRVAQTLPWNWRGWHCGKGTSGLSANNTHISFEICEPSGHTYQGGTMIGYDVEKNAAYFSAIYENSVDLCAYLCKQYKLNPMEDGVVICHSEGYKRGIASNHADVMHWFPKHGKNMDTFRSDVAQIMKGEPDMTKEEVQAMIVAAQPVVYTAVSEVPTWAQPLVKKAVDANVINGDSSGRLHLTTDNLVNLKMLDNLGLIVGAK